MSSIRKALQTIPTPAAVAGGVGVVYRSNPLVPVLIALGLCIGFAMHWLVALSVLSVVVITSAARSYVCGFANQLTSSCRSTLLTKRHELQMAQARQRRAIDDLMCWLDAWTGISSTLFRVSRDKPVQPGCRLINLAPRFSQRPNMHGPSVAVFHAAA